MDCAITMQAAQDDFAIEYEMLATHNDTQLAEADFSIQQIDQQMAICQKELEQYNADIARLTSNADGLDYTLAALSGVLTGIIDSLFVGQWDMKSAKAWSSQELNNKIVAFANKDPEFAEFIKKQKNRDDSSLAAIEFLEKKYKLPGDAEWKYSGSGITAKTHHLDDFCHHPTVIGLICCVIVQYSKTSIYYNNANELVDLPIVVNEYGKFVGKTDVAKLFSGVVNWFFNCSQIMANRKGHLFSDMIGSFSAVQKKNQGMGLPGSFLSTMKELSATGIFNKDFAENLRKAYQNGIGTGKSQIDLGVLNSLFDGAKLDMRTEMAVGHELKRQALPVVINEVLVRGAYFIRRFISEIQDHKSLQTIEWKNVLPFNNRTIARMLTIASGAFTAFDLGDAAIRSGGFNAACVMRINFVGVGRFAIALAVDTGMGAIEAKKAADRQQLYSEMLELSNAKMFFKDQKMWVEIESTVGTLLQTANNARCCMEESEIISRELESCMDEISVSIEALPDEGKEYTDFLAEQLLY